jgi:hypothetical protein
MAYIVLTIVGIMALILVKKEWRENKKIIFVGATIFLSALVYALIDALVLQAGGPSTKGDKSFFAKIPWLDIGLYLVMVIGMASKYLFDAICDKDRKKIKFNKWQFLKPFLVSPIIFAAVYSIIPESDSIFLLLIFSYQNGFFWQTMLYKAVPNQEETKK